MSNDAKLFINSKYSIVEIQAVLDRAFKIKTQAVSSGIDCNYIYILAEIEGKRRRLSVFLNMEVNGFIGTSISLQSNGNAILALQTLAHVFGGFLCKTDTREIYDGYDGALASQDGLVFWVRSAIINGINADDVNELKNYVKSVKSKWSKEDKV